MTAGGLVEMTIIVAAVLVPVIVVYGSVDLVRWYRRKKKMPSPKRTFDLVYACGHSYHFVTRIGKELMLEWIAGAKEELCGKCEEEEYDGGMEIYGDGEDQISYDSAMYRN